MHILQPESHVGSYFPQIYKWGIGRLQLFIKYVIFAQLRLLLITIKYKYCIVLLKLFVSFPTFTQAENVEKITNIRTCFTPEIKNAIN